MGTGEICEPKSPEREGLAQWCKCFEELTAKGKKKIATTRLEFRANNCLSYATISLHFILSLPLSSLHPYPGGREPAGRAGAVLACAGMPEIGKRGRRSIESILRRIELLIAVVWQPVALMAACGRVEGRPSTTMEGCDVPLRREPVSHILALLLCHMPAARGSMNHKRG